MIRVSTTAAALLAAIEAHRPGWVARAEARTEALAAGESIPSSRASGRRPKTFI